MSREIKFRAWWPASDKMVFGPTDGNESPGWVVTMAQSIEDVVLMQYSGLKDFQGFYIYEDDILLSSVPGFPFAVPLKVAFVKGCFCVVLDNKGQSIELPISDLEGALVIGNIHQNPEKLFQDGRG